VLSLLMSLLSENVIPLVVGLYTSHAVWKTLETAFTSPSNTCVLHLHMQLQRPQESDESVSTFLQRLKAHADEISTAGRPIPLANFNIYVFKGLKSEFKDLVTTLSARSEPVIYYELLRLLLSHEFFNNESLTSLSISNPPNSSTMTSPSANLTTKNPTSSTPLPPSRNQRGRARGHGRDHRSFNPSFSTRPPFPNTPPRFPPCQIFSRTNHDTSRCYYSFQTSPTSPTTAAPSPYRVAHYTAPSLDSSSPQPYNWYPDTGATHHVTPDLTSLYTFY
ncbi:UBN2 domain-containing protein, partial [Cephalotus follicularis]